MPLLAKVRVLGAKIETTPGTAIALAAADAAHNVFNPVIQPTIATQERQGQAAFSQLPSVPGARGGTITFTTELYGDGAGGVPLWASTFFPACGWVNTAGTFSPKSESPGTNVKTLTIGCYENGVFKSLVGAMGDFEIICPSGQLIMFNWTFTGIWVTPTDVAILAPTYPVTAPFRYASALSVIGPYGFKHSQLTLRAGNEVILREDATTDSGYSTALITGRKVTGTIDPESTLVASKDTYTEWLARDQALLGVTLDDGADTINVSAPKVQFTNLQEGERSGNQIDSIDFQCNRSAAAGNDELTISFSAS